MSTRALLASPLGFLIGMCLGALGGGGVDHRRGGKDATVPRLEYLTIATTQVHTSTEPLALWEGGDLGHVQTRRSSMLLGHNPL